MNISLASQEHDYRLFSSHKTDETTASSSAPRWAGVCSSVTAPKRGEIGFSASCPLRFRRERWVSSAACLKSHCGLFAHRMIQQNPFWRSYNSWPEHPLVSSACATPTPANPTEQNRPTPTPQPHTDSKLPPFCSYAAWHCPQASPCNAL